MRYLNFLIILLLIAIPASAAEVTLAWDASQSEGVDSYRVYDRDYTHPYSTTPLWEGPELTCTVTVPDGREVAFVATAYKNECSIDLDGNPTPCESAYSNEVVYHPEIVPPSPPSNFLVRILTAVLDFFGGWLG